MDVSLNTLENVEEVKIKKAVPAVLALMIFALVIDNSFKIISPDLAKAFNISATAVSWQVTLAGLVIGIGAVVYASLSDSISVRTLLVKFKDLWCFLGTGLLSIVFFNYCYFKNNSVSWIRKCRNIICNIYSKVF